LINPEKMNSTPTKSQKNLVIYFMILLSVRKLEV
jgi:hypothetical protein